MGGGVHGLFFLLMSSSVLRSSHRPLNLRFPLHCTEFLVRSRACIGSHQPPRRFGSSPTKTGETGPRD